jgi:hypothetical protein
MPSMPLRDHFHPPVNDTHSWDEVHGQWPGEIVRGLRNILPAGVRAAPNVRLGDESATAPDTDEGGTATLATLAPTLTVEADLSGQDEYEVRIYDAERGRVLVAAIEIVSPSNKDRPASREVFVGKLTTLLQQGICVSVVDLVSARQANLYAELLTLLGRSDPSLGETPPALYAVTLRARKRPRQQAALLDAWFYPMTVGQSLPTLPIWLAPALRVMLPLETSYEEACRILGIA